MPKYYKRLILAPLMTIIAALFCLLILDPLQTTAAARSLPVSNNLVLQPGFVLTTSQSLPSVTDLPLDTWDLNNQDLSLFYTQDETLYRFDVEQQSTQPIAHTEGARLLLSPDGLYLAYSTDDGLYVLRTKTGEIERLLEHLPPTESHEPRTATIYEPVAWSKQNDLLIRLFVLPNNLGWIHPEEGVIHPLGVSCLQGQGDVAWSNFGDKIAVGSSPTGRCGMDLGLTFIDRNTLSKRRVVDYKIGRELGIEEGITAGAEHIAWTANDRQLAVSLEERLLGSGEPFHRLYLVSADKRYTNDNLRPLTHNTSGVAGSPVWSPQGILYYALNSVETETNGIYRYSPATQVHELVLAGDLHPLNFSPDGGYLLYREVNPTNTSTKGWHLWFVAEQTSIEITQRPSSAHIVGWLAGEARQPAWQYHSVIPGRRLTTMAIDQVYTTADGLTDIYQVTAIANDDQGRMWFGTSNGVRSFDGQQWKTYTTTHGLISNNITDIAIDMNGSVWTGSFQGVNSFDGQQWKTYTTTHGLVSSRNEVNAVAVDTQGDKWFATEAGVSQFDGTTWTTYTTDDGLAFPWVNAIAVDAQGDKWFATQGGGISHFDGTTWTTYTAAEGLASNIVYAIAIDADGTIWAGTSGGVSHFDGATWTTYTTDDGLVSNIITDIAIDQDGHKWFSSWSSEWGTEFDGAIEFDDSRRQPPPPVTASIDITTPLTMPLSTFEVSPPFLIDESAERMYVSATRAERQPPVILVLTLDGQPLIAYDLAGLDYNLARKIALDQDNGWLYIDLADNQGLAVINTRTDRLHTIISLPEEIKGRSLASPPAPLAVPTTNQVIITRDNVVYIADPESGAIVETIPFDTINNRKDMADVIHSQYDILNDTLYLTFMTYHCTSAMGGDCDGYTTVSYDLKNGREIARNEGDRPGQTLAGQLYSGYFTCIGAFCGGRRSIWREGQPWFKSEGWKDHDGYMVFDAARQQFYEISMTSHTTYVRAYDAETMALLWHQPRPSDGWFINYDTQTQSLRFWDQGDIQTWPIQPPSPEPLVASSPPTTPVRSLVVSPNWPISQTLIGTWENLYRGTSDLAYEGTPSPYHCNYPPQLYISLDGGQRWTRSTGGLIGACGLVTVAFSPTYTDDQILFGGTRGLGFVKSTDGGQLWLPSVAGLTNMGVGSILISPGLATDKTVFVLGGGIIHRSTDGGQTWQLLHPPNQEDWNNKWDNFAISPDFDQDRTLLAISRGELLLSSDGGDQWRLVGPVPSGTQRLSIAPLFAKWQVLFVSGKQDDQSLLYRSDDGGQSWQVVLTGTDLVQELVFTPNIEQNRPVFARTNDTLYRSMDGGLTWTEVTLPDEVVPTALAISPNFAKDHTLFIGTDQGEILTLEIP